MTQILNINATNTRYLAETLDIIDFVVPPREFWKVKRPVMWPPAVRLSCLTYHEQSKQTKYTKTVYKKVFRKKSVLSYHRISRMLTASAKSGNSDLLCHAMINAIA